MFQVNQIVYSGNTFAPTREKITSTRSWDEVPEAYKQVWRTIEYHMTEEQFAARQYFVSFNGNRYVVTPDTVFNSTRFTSEADMAAAYASREAA
jgi:hypothetical protein